MNKYIALGLTLLLTLVLLGTLGCEDMQRSVKSFKANTVGIERKVVWTGFDGSRKVWEGRFKIESSKNGNVVYFIDDNGKTVILGPGYYSVEQ
ncbi:hypothetical protein [Desulfohalobium retbaense]|uniref:Lipoprotein n=1 Tax=Desulfohalobium retbaense (strain ATCC 49708 / DSM 5692 / JCM 16813 / HR100) TaxID=485915 RepID=C8X1W2_DESRD|nr:hypothetical protein [Desulfohalobium retbaense]ACV68534.1 hypothetical protein Dret_1246 [Desulfohalobium retbaense DSM 5692]